ncbi:MAG: hypothetical protein HUU06_07935 [Planctomycetaceae bacterium]|nr:hypothetical protein [Planctomycetota bacterium]NUN52698.1 hypothetical protein [Planctomycetaceae bacterium]
MSSTRTLVDLIESHSDALTDRLVSKIRSHQRTLAFHGVDEMELARRARAIYGHLGYWLRSSSELQVEDAFFEVGRERFAEGIPLADVVAAQLLTRRNLWEFLDERLSADSAAELRGELDLQILVVRFFDHTILHTVRGYEAARKEGAQGAPPAARKAVAKG